MQSFCFFLNSKLNLFLIILFCNFPKPIKSFLLGKVSFLIKLNISLMLLLYANKSEYLFITENMLVNIKRVNLTVVQFQTEWDYPMKKYRFPCWKEKNVNDKMKCQFQNEKRNKKKKKWKWNTVMQQKDSILYSTSCICVFQWGHGYQWKKVYKYLCSVPVKACSVRDAEATQ